MATEICGISVQDINNHFEKAHNRIANAHYAIGEIRKEFSSLPNLPAFWYEDPPKAIRTVTKFWCNINVNIRDWRVAIVCNSLLSDRITPKQILDALQTADVYAERWEKKAEEYRRRCEAAALKFAEKQRPHIDAIKTLLENSNSSKTSVESLENSTPQA